MKYTSLTITVHGQSVHGSQPHLGHDAIVTASKIIMDSQLLISRIKNPLEPALLTFTKVQACTQFNIITDLAILHGVLGAETPAAKKRLQQALEHIVKSTSAVLCCTADITYADVACMQEGSNGN